MKMADIQTVAVLWLLLITQTGRVCSDTQFLERSEGDSVVLICEMEPRSPPPVAMYLNRSWLRPGKVLFKLESSDFHMDSDGDKNRTGVSGEPSSHHVKVSISELRASDTDRYYCEFVLDNPSSEDTRLPGKTDFFLLVTAGGQCGCSGYSSLLYALSSAVAILVFILFAVFVVVYKGKSRRNVKSHPQAPIYEEMTGVKSNSRKLASLHLEETESSEYRNCAVKKSCPENHYESPTGALHPRRGSWE